MSWGEMSAGERCWWWVKGNSNDGLGLQWVKMDQIMGNTLGLHENKGNLSVGGEGKWSLKTEANTYFGHYL